MTTDATAVMDQITVAKTLAMLVLGLGSFVLGVVPLKLTKWWRKGPSAVTSVPPPPPPPPPSSSSSSSSSSASSSRGGHSHGGDTAAATSPVVSLLLCFGGGVLLFTTLLHLQPEVREGVSRLQRAGRLPDGQGTEHLGDLIFCAGFFVVFFVDEIVHSVLDRCAAAGRANHGSAEEVLHRSMSLRRRTMSIPRASLLQSGCSPSSMPSVAGGASTASIRELLDKDEKRYRPAARWDATAAVRRGDDRPRPPPPPPLSPSRRHHTGDDVEKRPTKTTEPSAGDEHSFRGLFAVLALSFHEVFEGLAIGLEERVDNVWYLFVAVATHKLVIAFCIGLELAWSNTRRPVLVVYVATFAVVTPVGIAIGMALVRCGTATDDGAPGRLAVVLQGLAAGTLLYVVFFEVLARHKQSGFAHLLSILFGFTVLLVLQMMTHHHSHGPTDNNSVHHHQHSDHHDHSSHGNHHVHDHSSHENHHIHDH